MKQIVSLSGGKDSTAMLLMMLDRGEDVHSAVYFDTGEFEFPQMVEHINRLERDIAPVPLVRVRDKYSLLEHMLTKKIKSRTTGELYHGLGWPSQLNRWCTTFKTFTIDKYRKSLGDEEDLVQLIGYAADELKRTDSPNLERTVRNARFPLVEYGVTEADALKYCFDRGYTWDGLYKYFHRVSCFCCPLQRVGNLRKLRKNFPDLWNTMLGWEDQIEDNGRSNKIFHGGLSVHELDEIFMYRDWPVMKPRPIPNKKRDK